MDEYLACQDCVEGAGDGVTELASDERVDGDACLS